MHRSTTNSHGQSHGHLPSHSQRRRSSHGTSHARAGIAGGLKMTKSATKITDLDVNYALEDSAAPSRSHGHHRFSSSSHSHSQFQHGAGSQIAGPSKNRQDRATDRVRSASSKLRPNGFSVNDSDNWESEDEDDEEANGGEDVEVTDDQEERPQRSTLDPEIAQSLSKFSIESNATSSSLPLDPSHTPAIAIDPPDSPDSPDIGRATMQDDARPKPTTHNHTPQSPTIPSSTDSQRTCTSEMYLNLNLPSVQSVQTTDGLFGLWTVFTKCKGHLREGERLENISWRLWYQACAANTQQSLKTATLDSESADLSPIPRGRSTAAHAYERADETSRSHAVSADFATTDIDDNHLIDLPSDQRRTVPVGGIYGSPVDEGESDSDEYEDVIDDADAEGEDADDDDLQELLTFKSNRRKHTSSFERLARRRSSGDPAKGVTTSASAIGARNTPKSHTSLAPLHQKRRSSSTKSTTSSASFVTTDSAHSNGFDRNQQRRISGTSSTSNRPVSSARQNIPSAGAPDIRSDMSAPKANSYPTVTPSQSLAAHQRPSLSTLRSQSHAPPSGQAGQTRRWDHRSLGEVITSVFKTPSLVDLAKTHRSPVVNPNNELTPSRIIPDFALPPRDRHPIVSRRPDASLHTIEQEPSPLSSPGPRPAEVIPDEPSPSSSASTNRRSMAPRVNVVEPTPVPSRVGSLGDATPPHSRSHSTPAAFPAIPEMGSGEPQSLLDAPKAVLTPKHELSNPLETALRSSPEALPNAESNLPPLSESALAKLDEQQQREEDVAVVLPRPATGQASQSTLTAGKRTKKSIFFIQSGSGRRDSNRQRSVDGGSDYSSETGSTLGSEQQTSVSQRKQGGLASSPLAQKNVGIHSPRPSRQHSGSSEANAARSASLLQANQDPQDEPIRSTSSSKKVSHVLPSSRRRLSSGVGQEKKPNVTHAQPPSRRPASAANMAGKFAGEKQRAAAAIEARLQMQQEQERAAQAAKREKLLAAKRQQSEPNFAEIALRARAGENAEQGEEGETSMADDDDAWSSETDETSKPSANDNGYLSFGKGQPKRAKSTPMDLLKAADEAQRQRELFAKRAIFGNSNGPQPDAKPNKQESVLRPGLLSNLFDSQRDVLRRGESMVNLNQTPLSPPSQTQRSTETTVRPSPAFGMINRSKSVVALPIATGVSVGREGLLEEMGDAMPQVKNRSPEAAKSSHTTRSRLRLPPKPKDADEFSSESSPNEDGGYLAKSEAIRRLDAIGKGERRSSQQGTAAENESHTPMVTAGGDLLRTQSHPMPMNHVDTHYLEPALPQTPTTRRRQMLATELPEDLRLNLIWERQSRVPKYPARRSIATSTLRPSASHHDLPEQSRDAEPIEDAGAFHGGPQSEVMRRQRSNPVQGSSMQPPSPVRPLEPSAQTATPSQQTSGAPAELQQQPPQASRRRAPNLLSGGAFLRPLTSAHPSTTTTGGPSSVVRADRTPHEDHSRDPAPRPREGRLGQRSKSTVDVTTFAKQGGKNAMIWGYRDESTPDTSSTAEESDYGRAFKPYSRRRQTENADWKRTRWGDNDDEDEINEAVSSLATQKTLKEREGELSSSFRSHGW